jgi:hypothetical protein
MELCIASGSCLLMSVSCEFVESVFRKQYLQYKCLQDVTGCFCGILQLFTFVLMDMDTFNFLINQLDAFCFVVSYAN